MWRWGWWTLKPDLRETHEVWGCESVRGELWISIFSAASTSFPVSSSLDWIALIQLPVCASLHSFICFINIIHLIKFIFYQITSHENNRYVVSNNKYIMILYLWSMNLLCTISNLALLMRSWHNPCKGVHKSSSNVSHAVLYRWSMDHKEHHFGPD